MALKANTQEGIYLNNILKFLKKSYIIPQNTIKNDFSLILVDNLSTKKLSENSSHHKRTKHIDIAYHFIRDTIKSGDVKVIHIPDKLNISDPLTKGLFRPKFDWFKKAINLLPS